MYKLTKRAVSRTALFVGNISCLWFEVPRVGFQQKRAVFLSMGPFFSPLVSLKVQNTVYSCTQSRSEAQFRDKGGYPL